MNAEEIRRVTEETPLTKQEFLDTLEEELYRVPFRTAADDVYPVKVERVGKDQIEVHMSDETVFKITVE